MFPRIRKIFSYECGLRFECGECSVVKVCGQHIVCLSVIRLKEPGEGGRRGWDGCRVGMSRLWAAVWWWTMVEAGMRGSIGQRCSVLLRDSALSPQHPAAQQPSTAAETISRLVPQID